MKVYFATQNKNKLKEIQKLLPPGMELLGLNDLGITEEIPETADTIEGNSAMKARYVHERCQVPCFADDTGLEVAALNNEPGVYSARYAGEHKSSEDNMDLLLQKLKDHDNRNAQFKTVITYIDPKGTEHSFTGIAAGEITKQRTGQQGFGYDPIFQPKGYPVTFAEMDTDTKNTISHRGKAFAKLVAHLTGSNL